MTVHNSGINESQFTVGGSNVLCFLAEGDKSMEALVNILEARREIYQKICLIEGECDQNGDFKHRSPTREGFHLNRSRISILLVYIQKYLKRNYAL